jgi:hypothetical protein
VAHHRLAAALEIHITDLVQRPAFAAERGGDRHRRGIMIHQRVGLPERCAASFWSDG